MSKYKVLWVDDEIDIEKSTQTRAKLYGLEFERFPDWAEAKLVVEENFNDYSAIVLDVFCKMGGDASEGPDKVFVSNVLSDLREIFKAKGRPLPWYLFSAREMDSDVIKDARYNRKGFESEWGKEFYKKSKDSDVIELFENILKVAKNPTNTIALSKHEEVFDLVGEGRLIGYSDARDKMLTMLNALYSTGEPCDTDAGLIRDVLEYVFRAARKVGLLAEECIDENDHVRLNDAWRYMSGMDTKHSGGVRYGRRGGNDDGSGGDRIFTPEIERIVDNLLKYSNPRKHTDEQKENIHKNRELFFGYVMHLCHFIKWFGENCGSEQDWKRKSFVARVKRDGNFLYANNFKLPPKFCANKGIKEGDVVCIFDWEENTEGRDRRKHPWFAKNFELVHKYVLSELEDVLDGVEGVEKDVVIDGEVLQ